MDIKLLEDIINGNTGVRFAVEKMAAMIKEIDERLKKIEEAKTATKASAKTVNSKKKVAKK